MNSAAVLALVIAFVGGVASFASPCCLPLVPAYIGYMVGASPEPTPRSRLAAMPRALAFSIGFSTVFVGLWASIGFIGYVLPDYVWLIRDIGGAVLVFMGLHVAGLISIQALYRDIHLPVGQFSGHRSLAPAPAAAGIGQAALVGVIFAAGWTPCIGPILSGIIGLASTSESAIQGTVLLVAYAAGLAVPFILAAIGATSILGRLSWIRDHYGVVSAATGTMLVAVGLLMVTNTFVRLAALAPALPGT